MLWSVDIYIIGVIYVFQYYLCNGSFAEYSSGSFYGLLIYITGGFMSSNFQHCINLFQLINLILYSVFLQDDPMMRV